MERRERMEVFLELLSCTQPLYFWEYDAGGSLVRSTCPTEKMLDTIFRRTGCHELLTGTQEAAPMLLTGEARLMWIAACEMGGKCYFFCLCLRRFLSLLHRLGR